MMRIGREISGGILLLALALPLYAAPRLTLESIFLSDEHPEPELPAVHWLEDGSAMIEREDDATARQAKFFRVDPRSGERSEWLVLPDWDDAIKDGHELSGIQVDAQGERVLVRTNEQVRWRHSRQYDHWIVERQSGERWRLSEEGAELHAKWSPEGDRIAFVRAGNLFVVDVATRKARALTEDGSSVVLNGDPDWVYEEELTMTEAWWWSSDGRHIAYLHTDAAALGQFPLVLQGEESYPKLTMLPYPKAGSANSTVTLRVVEVESGTTRDLRTLGPDDGYFARLHFAPDAPTLVYEWLPRAQNRWELSAVDLESGQHRLLYSEDSKGWIEIRDDVRVLSGDRLLIGSERDGWRHLYLLDGKRGRLRQLTRGEWEMRSLIGVSEDEKQAWLATTRGNHLGQSIERLELSDGKLETLLSGDAAWHEARVAPGGRYLLHELQRVDRRPELYLCDADAKPLRAIHADPMNDVQSLPEPEYRFDSFTTPERQTFYTSWILPPDFDASRRYPVLMYCYGGPESQTVRHGWTSRGRSMFHRYMAQEGWIVFMVDGRGSGGRGRDFRQVVARRLGGFEADDQLAAVGYLKTLDYVDPKRIALWGWSYGGYVSTMALLKGKDALAAGIAVAPVSDWRFYDTLYTERYMGLPQENAEGYDAGSLLTYAEQLERPLLLIHGSGDDNVHPQNSLRLMTALQEAGKPFELMVYPDKAHAIAGDKARYHLYRTMHEFLQRVLQMPEPVGARR